MDTSARDCLHLFDTSVEGRLSEGWRAGVLRQRTRAVYAGPMLDVDTFPVWDTATARAAKTEAQSERHGEALRRLNARNARRRLIWIVNANFGAGDLILTLEYAHGKQPEDDAQAARDIRNFLQRVKYRRKKLGLPPIRYIYITERTESKQYGVRYHHHIIMSGDIGRDEAERIWTKKHGGIANARIAQPTEKHLTGFARYLTLDKRNRTMEEDGKNPQRKAMRRGWNSSLGLKMPKARESDKKISIRKAQRVAEAMGDFDRARDILEKLYPGYTLLEVSAKKSAWTAGVYIRAQLRKDAPREGENGHGKVQDGRGLGADGA